MSKVPNKMKRTQRAKARRLAAEEARAKVAKIPSSREVVVKAQNLGDTLLCTVRAGYFSPVLMSSWSIDELAVADAHDNPTALVETIMKAGLAVMGGLFRTKVLGLTGEQALKALAENAGKWMKLDIEALRKEIAEERAAEPTPVPVPPTEASTEQVLSIPIEPAADKFRQMADEVTP